MGLLLEAILEHEVAVALTEDAIAAPVLAGALPGDDKVPIRGRGHRGQSLVARGVGVDLELAPLGDSGRAEALGQVSGSQMSLSLRGQFNLDVLLRLDAEIRRPDGAC